MNLKNNLRVSGIFLTVVIGMSVGSVSGAEKGPYEPTWESLNQHNPGGVAPDWIRDGKFGFYFCWGAYSVPAFRTQGFGEWYGKWMNTPGHDTNAHHIEKYGDPAEWPYHFFIDGAKDKAGNWVKFEPKLKSKGGKWDPDAWAKLFADAGAKWAGPLAQFHDNYAMWDSEVNPWNTQDKIGLDIVGEITKAIRKKNLKVVTTFHHAYPVIWEWWPLEDPNYLPAMCKANGDTYMQTLYGQLPHEADQQFWLDTLKEVIEKYEPDFIYHDVGLAPIAEKYRLEHLAHYYNHADKLGKDVLVTWKLEGEYNHDSAIIDFEGGATDDISKFSWVSDNSISHGTWSYVEGEKTSEAAALLHSLITIVSKNGVLMVCMSPKADGTIPQSQQDSVLEIGQWLKSFGECIYNTRPWATYGEGPSHTSHGSRTCTAKDIRYTRNKQNNVLYAIVCGWPGDGQSLNMTYLKKGNIDLSRLEKVELLGIKSGTATSLKWKQDATGMQVTMPAKIPYDVAAYPVRLTFSGTIPASPVLTRSPLVSTEQGGKGVIMGPNTPHPGKDKGVAARLEPGIYTTADLKKMGFEDNTIRSVKVNSGWTVILYDGDNCTGESKTCTWFIRNMTHADHDFFGKKVSSIKVIKADVSPVFK